MAAEELKVDISHQICLRCKIVDIQNWSRNQSICSPEFRFQGGRFKLEYYKDGTGHRLYLIKCSTVALRHPFRIFVKAERYESGRGIVHVLCHESSITYEFGNANGCRYNIWYWEEEEILRAVPELHRVLTLLVFLKPEDSSICTLLSSTPFAPDVPCLESLSEDFSQLLDQGPKPDVEFQCNGQSFEAHGAVVSARSQVIARMLATDMVEGRTRVVKIPDMEPDVFGKFLRYIYTGKLDGLTLEVALGLFEAGDQYAVAGLAKRCSEYVGEHLSVEKACEVLAIADAHSDEGLVEKVVDYMVATRVPVDCEAWPAFCDDHPRLATKVLNRVLKRVRY